MLLLKFRQAQNRAVASLPSSPNRHCHIKILNHVARGVAILTVFAIRMGLGGSVQKFNELVHRASRLPDDRLQCFRCEVFSMERNGNPLRRVIEMPQLNMAAGLMVLIKPSSFQSPDDERGGYARQFRQKKFQTPTSIRSRLAKLDFFRVDSSSLRRAPR